MITLYEVFLNLSSGGSGDFLRPALTLLDACPTTLYLWKSE